MTKEEIESLKPSLLSLIPTDGSTIGNITLLSAFRDKQNAEIRDEDYWEIRNSLIDDGTISTSKGRGGSVYRLDVEETKAALKAKTPKEKDLYEPIIETLQKFWVKAYDLKNYVLQNTANQGRRKTGGKWTRTDIALISIRSYTFIPGKILEVTTFEVKPASDYGVESVFETAAHSLFAHKSYLIIHLPGGLPDSEEFERIKKQCQVFGIGLIAFENPKDWATFEIIIESDRKQPDPADVNLFITQQISANNKTELLERLK